MMIEQNKVYKVNTPNGVVTYAYAIGIVSSDSEWDWNYWLMYSQKRLFVLQEKVHLDSGTDTEYADYYWKRTVCDYCEIPEAEFACNGAYHFASNFGEDAETINVIHK